MRSRPADPPSAVAIDGRDLGGAAYGAMRTLPAALEMSEEYLLTAPSTWCKRSVVVGVAAAIVVGTVA